MLRRLCRAKIHRATLTHCRLNYEGSVEIDAALLDAAGILEHEMVLIANLANGQRFDTYVIRGPKNSGIVSLNGAAARLGTPGDKVIIISTAWMEEKAAKKLKPKFVLVDHDNRVRTIRSGVSHGPLPEE